MIFKYFKPEEVIGLDQKLVQMLDRAREIAGIPFIITSGVRSPQHDIEVGGSGTGAHTRGLAVDLKCNTSDFRLNILSACIAIGFKRIGVKSNHIHVDIDKTLPQDVLWLE
jgi:uncharacterized protein YcbK (DUF882 family)